MDWAGCTLAQFLCKLAFVEQAEDIQAPRDHLGQYRSRSHWKAIPDACGGQRGQTDCHYEAQVRLCAAFYTCPISYTCVIRGTMVKPYDHCHS